MRPAAQYLRMSTDQQKFSLANQAAAIGVYAIRHNFEIVATFEDAGKSGLTLKERPGLQSLLTESLSGSARFSDILVLDVSRWGRFQDPDQAAHYEYICREVGVSVHYCSEAFENDNSTMSSVVKHLKRVMAGEYSRELSERVKAAKRRQIPLGNIGGGSPPYATRRVHVRENGERIGVAERGQRKALATDRTTLMWGPPAEVALVKRVFRMFVRQQLSLNEIARRLNAEGYPTARGLRWTGPAIRKMLTNEIAIGNYVWGRTSVTLKRPKVNNPPQDWIRVALLPGIIKPTVFRLAQERLKGRHMRNRFDERQMLGALKRLLREKGTLSSRIIKECPYTPSPATYVIHFGSLYEAFAKVGFTNHYTGYHRLARPAPSAQEVLTLLREVHRRNGYVAVSLLGGHNGGPSLHSLVKHYGTVRNAYAAAGIGGTHADLCRAGQQRSQALNLASRTVSEVPP